jgi:hypothetical protein
VSGQPRKKLKEEEEKMKKAGLLLLVLVILGGWTVKDSDAGQWCWDMDFGEYMKLSFTKNDPNFPFWTLSGMSYAPGESIMPVAGTMVKNANGTRRLLTLTITNADATSWFGYADIDALTKNGTIIFYCANSDTYSTGHTLTKVDCRTLPAP